MAKYSNQVVYDIKTNFDLSGIKKLQTELFNLKQVMSKGLGGKNNWGLNDTELKKSIYQVERLQSLFNKGFDATTGTYNIKKINSLLNTTYKDVQNCTSEWNRFGIQGQKTLTTVATTLTKIQKEAVNLNTLFGKMGTTMSNTIRWGISATVFQGLTSELSKAINYLKNLDESLTNIQMVTNSSKEDMRELAKYANNAAQALGSTTVDYTNAVKVFVQEGFSEKESKQYANLSTKLANVSEQNTATTSDQITAFRNAFQLDYEQTVAAMDKVANVANNTASNVNELMTASQRAASVAQAVGASQDSFLASIATIESVTRQSAEEIGNGLKTIYQRFADIKVSGSTEDGVDYGQYAQALKSIGVDVLNAAGEFKGMDQILQETQEVWSSLSDTMKVAVGEKVAGKFQYNRFAALMNNPEYYQKALGATQNADGMMDQMNEYYMDSIEGRMKTLQAAGEQVITTLFNQDDIEPILETTTDVLNNINDIVDALGGMKGVLLALSPLVWKIFGSQISSGIASMTSNITALVLGGNNLKETLNTLGLTGLTDKSKTTKALQKTADFEGRISPESYKQNLAYVQQIGEAELEIQTTLEKTQNLLKRNTSILVDQQAANRDIVKIQKAENKETEQQIIKDSKRLQQLIQLKEQHATAGTSTFRDVNGKFTSLATIEKEIAAIQQRNQIALQEYKAGNNNIQQLKQKNEQLGFARKYSQEILQLVEEENLDYEKINEKVRLYQESLQRAGLSTKKIDELLLILQEDVNKINTGLQLFNDRLDKIKLEAFITSFGKLVSGTASALMSVQMFQEAGQQFEEGDYFSSTLSILMGISMVLPLLSSGMKALKIETLLATIAQEGLNIAMEANPVGAVFLAITALVAIIGSLVAISHALTEATYQANKEFEKQEEILRKTKKNYTDLRDNVESLKQSIDSIGESKKSLNDLTKGTDEWREAVRKLNDEVLTLIQTYPELAQYVNNDDGILNISQENLDKFYSDKLAETRHLQDINTVQQINTLDAQNNKLIENFSNQWGISKEEVRSALENEIISLTDQSAQVNSAFSELTKSVQSNNYAIDNFKNSIGTLTDYIDYSTTDTEVSSEKINTTRNQIAIEYGGRDLSRVVNNQEFINAVAEATGKSIISAKDVSPIDGDVELKLQDGETIKYTTDELLAILADSKIAAEIEEQILNDNIKVYEEFGAKYDSSSNEFLDANGNVITSLKDLASVTEEQSEIMSKFADDKNYKNFMSAIYGGVDEFTKKIASGNYTKDSKFADYEAGIQAFSDTEAFEAFKESKLIARSPELESFREQYNNFETLEDFIKAVQDGAISLEGLSNAVKKLTPDVVDLTTNINGNQFTNRVDLSSNEDAFKSFLEDSGMTEGAFNRMSRDAYEEEGGYYQEEKERLEGLIAEKERHANITEKEKEEIADLKSEMEDLDDAAKDSTAMILRMSNGVVNLRNKIEDISEILTNEALKGTTEWYEALDDLDKGLSEVLNIDAGTLSDKFIESGDALDYARRMAEGDMTAIDDLRRAASEDIIQNLTIQADTQEDVDKIRGELLSEFNKIQAEIDNNTITIKSDLDEKPFIQKLNELLAASQITEEQASNILSSMGMDAKIEHKKETGYVDAIEYHPQFTGDALQVGENGPRLPGIKMVPSMTKIKTEIDIPYLVGTHYTGSGVQTANTAASNPSYIGGYSNNPKPSSSSPKSSTPKVEKPKNVEEKKNAKNEWDYLTDITNDLERASAAVEKLAKLEDRLFGKNRVSQIRKLQGEYKNYISLLEQESKLAKEHARRLRTRARDENGNLTINGYANRAGFSQVSFDSKGNLENGKEIEAALTQRLNNAINDYNAHRNEDDASWYDDQVKHAQEEHDGFMKAMSDYQDTLKTIEDSENQIQEYKEKIQDAADEIVDAILEGVDKVIETNDKKRDFDRSVREWREGGKGYSHFRSDRQYYSEGLQEFLNPKFGINGQSTFDFSLSNLKKRYADAEDVFDINGKDKKRADDEKLSQTQALENLSEATEKVVNELNSMTEYYNSLLDTVEEMSSKMDDIIENRLQQYDNIEDFLDGRLDQLKLLFGEDYGAQVKFYNQKIDTNMSKMVDINTAIEAKQATVKQFEKLESSDRELSAEERQMLKDARDEVNKLQREQMATETKLLQDIASKLSAETRGEMKKAINDMFGGNDVEWIAQQWEIASRNSSQYLDDYNRAFELQKLQLKYQDLLNDTQETSLSIQQRISTHMNDQLGFLRNKKKLSEYDVQYAQKQLDILQKQIALEEARDNKSQMRLQRNAAGNYDFVYAADEDAINQATEALLNAQQEAYNLSKKIYLDTYNSAVEAALKTKETVVEIALDASLDTAEKQERIKYVLDNLKEYMDNSSIELKNISVNLYNDFIEADNKIAEENLGALSEVYQKIKDEYVKSLGTMTESSKNATDSMKEHLGAFLGEEGEEQTSGTARYVFNQFETLGNTSFSNLVQNSDGTWSSISENIKSTLNDKITPDLNDMFGEQGTLAKYFGDTGTYSNNLWNGLSTHIEKTVLPKITNDMKLTFLESDGGSDSIEGIVSLALSSIDSNFKLTEIKSLEKISSIDSAIDTAYANIRKYLGEYRQENNEALEEMGTSYGTFVSDSLEVAKEATDNLKGSTDEFKGSLELLKDEIKNTTTEIGYWKTALDNAYTASQDIIDQSYDFQTKLYEDQAAAAAFADELDRIASNSDLSVTTTYTEDHNINYNYTMSGEVPAGTATESVDSSSSYGSSYSGDTYGNDNGGGSSDDWFQHYSVHGFGGGMMFRTTSYAAAEAYKENHSRPGMPLTIKVGQWDTGGYTGTWTDQGIDDKNGKLAILHQKELVLNATDTENMLSAVEIVRDIMSGVNNLTSFGKSINNSSNFNDTIEQRVEISATFPGVTTALEIERALTELADNAYQYSHKYKY